jgi:hypothetical protein
MTEDTILALLALSALLWLFYGPWQDFCTDCARQYIFKRRDDVFDLATQGKLDFNSDEYKIIRASFNRIIRFAHELTLFNFILFYVDFNTNAGENAAIPVSHKINAAIERIKDEPTRQYIKIIWKEAAFALAVMLCAKSMTIIFLTPLLIVKSISNKIISIIMKEAERSASFNIKKHTKAYQA